MADYKVQINYTNKKARKLSLILGLIAFVGFYLWYLIDIPVRNAPGEISIMYYMEFLPRWVLHFFGLTTIIGVIAYLLFDIRMNLRGLLKLDLNSIVIESKREVRIIDFNELKRITVIALPFSLSRYRIEFIYHDLSFVRLKLRNKKDFDCILDNLYDIAPEEFEIHGSAFESIHK